MRLTKEKALAIRIEHIRDNVSYSKLAAKYGATRSAIIRLVNRQTYANLVDPYHPILLSHPNHGDAETEIPI